MHIAPDRFAEYIAELREFSGTHRVPCGKPEDLAQLLEALRSSQTFAMDFGSMIRSIVLNEHFQASDSELLTLVAIAWGGAQADDSIDHSPSLFKELEKNLQEVLRRGASEPIMPPIQASGEVANVPPNAPPGVDNKLRELEQASPDVQRYRQLLKAQDGKDSIPTQDGRKHVSGRRRAFVENGEPTSPGGALEKRTQSSRNEVILSHKPAERFFLKEESSDKPPVTHRSGETNELVRTRRFELSAAEIVATALTGLVAALLLNTASLPVYRSHVSVYLPSAVAGATNSSTGSPEALLRNGKLTEEVAQRLLVQPHPNPILREDAISRGMRDLNLGGRETILYANLVEETAHEVKVRHLEPQNLVRDHLRLPESPVCRHVLQCVDWSAGGATVRRNSFSGRQRVHPHDRCSYRPGNSGLSTMVLTGSCRSGGWDPGRHPGGLFCETYTESDSRRRHRGVMKLITQRHLSR